MQRERGAGQTSAVGVSPSRSTFGTSRVMQRSSALSMLVDVERLDDALPDLRVFELPAFDPD